MTVLLQEYLSQENFDTFIVFLFLKLDYKENNCEDIYELYHEDN